VGISLDLSRAAFHRQHGDILAVYTWVNDERALVLLPALRPKSPAWFVVCESAAWKYADPAYLAQQARRAAQALGMDETQNTWLRIATVIIEGLPDLIRMRSAPDPDLLPGSAGEIKLSVDGEHVTSTDIRVEKAVAEYA
jgi:hypothetical protein